MKIITKIFLFTCAFMTASTTFAAPDLAALRAMYPVIDRQEWNYIVEVVGDNGTRRERFQDGDWGFIDEEHEARHLERNKWFPVSEEQEKERALQASFLGNLLNDLSDLIVLDESVDEVVYGFHGETKNEDAEDIISVPSQYRLYYDLGSNNITRLTNESTESVFIHGFKMLSVQFEIDFSDGSNDIPNGFSREQFSIMKGVTASGEKIEQKELYRYSDFTISIMETIPVEAGGGIADGAGPISRAD